MIDISNQFKEIVRTNSKSNARSSSTIKQQQSTTNILKFSKPLQERDVLFKASISILHNIDTLRDMLVENRDSYIDAAKHTTQRGTSGLAMTDSERDEIDRISIKQIEVCNNSINKMESLVADTFKFQQRQQQQQQQQQTTSTITNMVDMIRDDPNDLFSRDLGQFDCKTRFYFAVTDQLHCYLSQVTNQFKKQREFRVNIKLKENERFQNSLSSPKADNEQQETMENETNENASSSTIENVEIRNRSLKSSKNQTLSSLSSFDNTFDGDTQDNSFDFDDDEKLIYEQQNHLLLGELETLPDQILTINQRIEELSQLFDQITPHILAQREQIDSIYDTGVHSTNYIGRGNEQIYQATKKTFDFRVMLLFFLIISSLSLLFLNCGY
ncbi:hypothetical protein DFA_02001 [Cavenderia fasciculata]|uniref:t-SNARE coiled-coil homology domain-containing protein n=1 Tax=Cavenderia fasciculata TaxID=261658 RepID=F4PR54_CACFS|nr:uncharacterized protein DFA_02001 [Cavenderia fasciculata]EGG22111.1 hypothetical protein DFA_02001 [Cavenderia fasciculata]|eukprot:XP_004359962.1 hypothetical protein DFA_02001 [Cavenderia fasciculata]